MRTTSKIRLLLKFRLPLVDASERMRVKKSMGSGHANVLLQWTPPVAFHRSARSSVNRRKRRIWNYRHCPVYRLIVVNFVMTRTTLKIRLLLKHRLLLVDGSERMRVKKAMGPGYVTALRQWTSSRFPQVREKQREQTEQTDMELSAFSHLWCNVCVV
ncbi:hypothetical protein KM043_007574 [Ampulex compressa]|nr:hypothetical protein KM043_007574 [Ampulex compressa]